MDGKNCTCRYCTERKTALASVLKRAKSPVVDVEKDSDSDLELVERDDPVVVISSGESDDESVNLPITTVGNNVVVPQKEYKDASTQTDREKFAVLGLNDVIPAGAEEVCVVELGQPFFADEFRL